MLFGAAIPRPFAGIDGGLFGLLLLLQLLDLSALYLQLLLLLLDRLLSLRLLVFGVLHLIADHISRAGAQSTADRGSGARMAYSRTDNSATTGAQETAA